MTPLRRAGLALALCGIVATGATSLPSLAAPRAARLVAVGDIGDCTSREDEKVADLVATLPGTIALLGDNVYENGTRAEYDECFRPAWGRLLSRTRAALGNHDYGTGNADTAIELFGLPKTGWYTYHLGTWRVIVLNSNCRNVGGCERGSPQWTWLRSALAREPSPRCTLAYWHHPRFSSGKHGSDPTYAAFWDLLAAAKADVVLAGHDHDYERIGLKKGIRSFVVGTGGRLNYDFPGAPIPGSEARSADVHGALQLSLLPRSYTWRFRPAAGYRFTDAGSGRCR
ncbi:MAG: metallophosphoesterase [Gaiellales bacterium]